MLFFFTFILFLSAREETLNLHFFHVLQDSRLGFGPSPMSHIIVNWQKYAYRERKDTLNFLLAIEGSCITQLDTLKGLLANMSSEEMDEEVKLKVVVAWINARPTYWAFRGPSCTFGPGCVATRSHSRLGI